MEPAVIVFFAAWTHDGAAISRALRERFERAQVIGCTTAGEFTQKGTVNGGVTALALSANKIAAASAHLAPLGSGVEAAVRQAADAIAGDLGLATLRDADPLRYVGIVLIDGLTMREEEVNEILGNVAPLHSFIGGSAGDDLQFRATRVFCNGQSATDAAVLLMMQSAVPFAISRTCSFVPTKHSFRVTRADVPNRVVYELDGRPVLDVYAEAVGASPDKLDESIFMSNPVGLLIAGEPWIRSPMRALPDGGLKFYCNIAQGMQIHLMEGTDLIADTRRAIGVAAASLGKPIAGGIAFNCVLRRLEMDAKGLHPAFLGTFAGLQVGGFHTYGESWLGHMNQTLTAVWFA